MKVLKGFYLVIMCILLMITVFIFQASLAINGSFFSRDQFQKIFTSDEAYDKFIKSEVGQSNPELQQYFKQAVDKNFYNKFASDLVNGLYDFLDEKTNKLPVIDFSSVQDKMINLAVEQEVAKQGAIAAKLDKNQIKAEVQKELNLPAKFDLNDMNSGDDITDKDIKIIYKFFQGLPTFAIIIMILIILAVIIAAVSPTAVIRWIGATSLITGLLTLASSQPISNFFAENESDEYFNLLTTKMIETFGSVLTSKTYIFIVTGVLFLILSFIPILRKKSVNLITKMHDSPKYKPIKISRILAALVLIILIPVIIYVYSAPVINATTTADKGTVNTSKTK